jgi:predicted acyl esterase
MVHRSRTTSPLTAINPWEGVSDVYRDLVMRGGMPDLGFAEMLQQKFGPPDVSVGSFL